MATSSSAQPVWQRSATFKFFASVKLAVVLLAVIIVAAIAGTIYESTFDAQVARAYVYGAPWFNFWLILLGTNLAVSALSRWPWRKHHVAFLVTHLGIITLLAGSLIGRQLGIEGTITLFKGDPPTNRLLVQEHQLRVFDRDGIRGYPADFLHRLPTPQRPRDLGTLASGAHLEVVGYAPAVDAKLNPKPVHEGGLPAVHVTIATAMMNQRLESWLLADHPQHGTFAMGLANIEFKHGAAPATTAGGETDMEESIFAFAKMPNEQVSRTISGGSTGAKLRLSEPAAGDKGQLTVSVKGEERTFSVADNLARDVPIAGTPYTLKIESYWPDLRIENGKLSSASEQPNNPAVVARLRGRGVPVVAPPDPHGAGADENSVPGAPPSMNAGNASQNHLTLFVADDGTFSYELASRKNGRSTGKLALNGSLPTGWADWQLTLDQVIPKAEEAMDFSPTPADRANGDSPDALRLRIEQNGNVSEQWAPSGWQVTLPTSPSPTRVAYGWRTIQLPIALELLAFEVTRNEGSDAPAGFKSWLRVSTAEGQSASGTCWMNNPFSFPGEWWHTWTGRTFKISQASWNPENLGQSTIQILRDPGWLLKWIGSLLIVAGVFMLFYVPRFRRKSSNAAANVERDDLSPRSSRAKSRDPVALEQGG